jgi:hypothetical protein
VRSQRVCCVSEIYNALSASASGPDSSVTRSNEITSVRGRSRARFEVRADADQLEAYAGTEKAIAWLQDPWPPFTTSSSNSGQQMPVTMNELTVGLPSAAY